MINTAKSAGDELVQPYLRDDRSSVTAYEKALRGFQRLHLQPGAKATVPFDILPERLERYERIGQWSVGPGMLTGPLGTSSEAMQLEGAVTSTDGTPVRQTTKLKTSNDDPI